jgi:hypothetical protein
LEKRDEENIGVKIIKNLKPKGRAMMVLNQIRRNIHYYKDRHTFVKLHKQYVRPYPEFVSPSWPPCQAGDIEKLEKVQEKAVKMVAGS